MTIRSDGHTVVLNIQDSPIPYITGGKLLDNYNLFNIHFHWGANNDNGSEHTLNGKSYPMEMHVVFTRSHLTFEEAQNDPEGIAVIGYFIEINDTETHQHALPLDIIADTLEDITTIEQPVKLRVLFPFSKLAHIFSTEYVTYDGSLTTPNFNEVVTWFICPHTLHIKSEQLQKFRELNSRGLVENVSNNREVQPLNSRSIYLARDVGRSATPCKHKIKHNIFKKAMFNDYYYNLNSCSKASANKKITLPDRSTYYFNDVVKDIANSSKPNRYCIHYRGYKLPIIYDFTNAAYKVVKCKH